jgi:iron-sulfur cluster assembly accessory protein
MKQLITISTLALGKIRNIIKTNNAQALLVSIKGGGCNGFNYELAPLKENIKDNKYDEIMKIDNVNIHLCGQSLMHLMGTHIDYKTDIMGERFDFSNNNIASKCGCGTSFTFIDSK